MKADIIGATGATGKDLLKSLLDDTNFSEVNIFVRRQPGIQHPKLKVHVIDFDNLSSWQHLVMGEVLFSCLGTTLKAAGSKQAQWKIDYDYQYEFAKAAIANGVKKYVLVSSGFTDPKSMFFYSRMKGQLEQAVQLLKFSTTIIFKPPVLVRKNSDRLGEKIGVRAVRFLNTVGLLRSQAPLPTEDLALAMIHAAKKYDRGLHVLEAKDIKTLLG